MNMHNMLGASEKKKETKENEGWQAVFGIIYACKEQQL